MVVRLREGCDVNVAIATLRELRHAAHNVITFNTHPVDQRDEYVRWSAAAELKLCTFLTRRDAESLLETTRHRDICSMPPGNQLTVLINGELSAKSDDFETLATTLETALARMKLATGRPAVFDSNVLLQCLRPDQIKWREVLGADARLMVPLRVIEEIDAKKYGKNDRLSGVARGLLPWLEGLFPSSDCAPVSLGDGTTIEVLLEPRPRFRPEDPDEEVLDVAQRVRQLAGAAVVVTADTAMRLRARAEGLTTASVPTKWLRPSSATTE